jgi:hypothetical protein
MPILVLCPISAGSGWPRPSHRGAFPAKIEPVELTINPQRRGEPSRSSRQVAHAVDAAIQPHDRDAFERLERPDQDAGSDAWHLTRDVQHVGAAKGTTEERRAAAFAL